MLFNARHAVGDSYRSETAASIESMWFYAFHTVWYRDGFQTAAFIESFLFYACHAARDSGRG